MECRYIDLLKLFICLLFARYYYLISQKHIILYNLFICSPTFQLKKKGIQLFPPGTLFVVLSGKWKLDIDLKSCYDSHYYDCEGFVISNNISDIPRAKVVIFARMGYNIYPRDMPKRYPDQLWVWLNSEPPHHVYSNERPDNMFNYTASYKRDSDIFTPYGHFIKTPGKTYHNNYFKPFNQKSKDVCWLSSSKWETNQGRSRYYEELKKYINIDVYGNRVGKVFSGNKCEFVQDCKFYLAFENTRIRDYVTEKVWENSFECGAIPIAFGPTRQNYVDLGIPNNSFIHVDDFENPKELANFLKKIGNDEELYNSYLKWRDGNEIYSAKRFGDFFCMAISYMKKYQPKPSKNKEIRNWFREGFFL